MSNPSVTIPQLRQIVEIALAAPVFQPIGLLSSPGVGKTMFFQNDFVELSRASPSPAKTPTANWSAPQQSLASLSGYAPLANSMA